MTNGGGPISPGLNAAAFVDLHLHSTASDGILPPEQVVAAASRAGISAMALTDHDTLAGVEAAVAAGRAYGVRVVPGVELSAYDGDREVHLLVLHVSRREVIEARLQEFQRTRLRRAEEIVSRLNGAGVPLSFDAVMTEAGDAAVGRPHVARALITHRHVRDQREAFDRYLGYGRPAYVEKQRITVGDAIDLAHQAGGLIFWAHPGGEGRMDRIEPLVRAGIDGLEVRHPSHSAEDILRTGAIADHFRILKTGGSDWHGAAEGPRQIGNMRVPGEWLALQEMKLSRTAETA